MLLVLLAKPLLATPVVVNYENPIQNSPNYPELLYWFVKEPTLKPDQYKRDIYHIAHDTPFDFPFLTERGNVHFIDNPEAHEAIAGIVKEAHANGLRLGMTFRLQSVENLRKFPLSDCQTLISDKENLLDENGTTVLKSSATLRYSGPVKAEALRVVIFKKGDDGGYDPSTVKDVTNLAKTDVTDPENVVVTVAMGSQYAGYTAFALITTWFATPDLFSQAYINWIHDAIDQYKDVPLDGTALDEFGYARIPGGKADIFRGHMSGKSFMEAFEKETGSSLNQTLFETRCWPTGHPEIRIAAINRYWAFFREGPLKAEQEFYNYSRQVFGEKTFAGIHNTFHNHFTNDEAWSTGINWWTIPRQYGQSDEDLSLPLRMGLLVAHPGPVMYDQFYSFDISRFAAKAMRDARFNGRIHYHGYNDTGQWGVDLSTAPFLNVIDPVEKKIRLLNRFEPAAPSLPLLVVFGMPALLDWYPDSTARNAFDVNGSLKIEEKVISLWDAGYDCAVVPSDLIDNGSLTLDPRNRPTLHGHTFSAVVYLYPEYATPKTLEFLDHYSASGGSLMLEGTATRDYYGADISNQFAKISAQAKVQKLDLNELGKLGVAPDPLRPIGGRLEDGSIILTDLASLQTRQPKPYSIEIQGHTFTGTFTGVLALKTDSSGRIQKLACGGFSSLLCDGKEVARLLHPADLILIKTDTGYQAIINGEPNSNEIHLGQ